MKTIIIEVWAYIALVAITALVAGWIGMDSDSAGLGCLAAIVLYQLASIRRYAAVRHRRQLAKDAAAIAQDAEFRRWERNQRDAKR